LSLGLQLAGSILFAKNLGDWAHFFKPWAVRLAKADIILLDLHDQFTRNEKGYSMNLSPKIRPSVEKLSFSPTLAINEQVVTARRQGQSVLHLGFGQAPFPVHPEIAAALQANVGQNHYLPSAGLPDLRQAVANFWKTQFEIDNSNVIIGPGSKELIFDIQMAIVGDLLLSIPAWVSYAPQATLLGDQIIKIPTQIEENYHPTPDQLESVITASQKMGKNPKKLLLNYPNNPTGLSPTAEQLRGLAEICRKHGIVIISDEIYGLVHHRCAHQSIATYYPEGTIITSGLSKFLSLGGYRLGIGIFPKQLDNVFHSIVRIASETWSTTSAPIQYAALAAFQNSPAIETYILNCTLIHRQITHYVRDQLISMGISYPTLDGGFYLYPNFDIFTDLLKSRGIHTSEDLATDLLTKQSIATLPGTAFGDQPKNLGLRLATCDFDGQLALEYSMANPHYSPEEIVTSCCPNIALACERMAKYFGSL